MFCKRGIIIFISFLMIVGNLILPKSVVKAVSDTTPPALNSISVDKSMVTGGDTVKVTMDVSDDISGVKYVSATYSAPSGGASKFVSLSSIGNGKYEGYIPINQNDADGTWKINYVGLTDNVGNSTLLYGYEKDLSAGNFQVKGTVSDTTPPVLNSVSVDKSIVTGGDTVKVTMDVSDDISGVKYVSATYSAPSGGASKFVSLSSIGNGKYEGYIPINQNDADGTWKINYVGLTDNVGNSTLLYGYEKDLSAGNFQVKGTVSDTMPPVLNSVSVDKSMVTEGNTVKVTMDVSDDISEVKYVSATYSAPSGGASKFVSLSSIGNGKYEGYIPINQNDADGTWKINYVGLTDNVGNSILLYGYEKDLSAGDFKVTSQNDTTPIPVTGITLDKQQLSLNIGQSANIVSIINPSNAGDKNVTWASDNTSVATVDNTGKVTAVSAGTANITVKTEDGGYSASCAVAVAKPVIVTQLSEDVNNDGVIDIKDLAQVAQNYNIKKNDANWNPLFDLNGDNIVDLYDLIKVSKVIGQEISMGNTQGNIVNGGYVAQSGDWIYYYNDLDNNKLYKEKTDGTGKMKLSDDSYVCNINVIGDWVYYTNQPGYGEGIFKVKTDGTGRVELSNEDAQYINVIGNWIYYQNVSSLRRMKTDGTGESVLCNNYAQNVSVVGDWAYYTDGLDNSKLYKIKTDGTEKTKLSDDYTAYLNVVGDWIYYSNDSDGAKIYKVRTDGTDKTKVSDIYSYNINISGDWIYYENSGNLYKMKLDRTDVTNINVKADYFINIIGDWIYYRNESDSERLYRIRTDWTGGEIVNAEVTGVGVSPSILEMTVGGSTKLVSSITPSYAKDQNIKWSSSNTTVAEVDGNGTVTAKSKGQAVITATSEDGGKTAQCIINIKQ